MISLPQKLKHEHNAPTDNYLGDLDNVSYYMLERKVDCTMTEDSMRTVLCSALATAQQNVVTTVVSHVKALDDDVFAAVTELGDLTEKDNEPTQRIKNSDLVDGLSSLVRQ